MIRWYSRMLRRNSNNRLNRATVLKLYNPCTQFPRDVRLSHRRIVPFSAHLDFFVIAPDKYSYLLTYLLTYLLMSILLISGDCIFMERHVRTKIFIRMSRYSNTKPTAELESDTVQYRNKYFVSCFVWAWLPKALPQCDIHTVKVIYCTRIIGHRQVTVRFMI